ncbi:MAG: orotate phosphoribosyltransferase [Chloroflexota bacterium]
MARALLEADAITLTPTAPVTFKSGLRSPVYVDSRRLIFHPGPWHIVIDAFASAVRDRHDRVEVLAGVESAGIPHSSSLAFAEGLPSVFVRKEAKGHGLARRIEGGDVTGRRVVLVEDMVTTGGSSLSAIEALREAGATVTVCVAIITYGFAGTFESFEAAGVELEVLTTFESVLGEAIDSGRLDEATAAPVRTWLTDPQAWQST